MFYLESLETVIIVAMVLVTLIFLSTFGCFITSLSCLLLIIRHYYFQQESFQPTFSNEAIIITGCDSGIGLTIAKYFYHSSNLKILCGFLNPEESEGFKELKILSGLNNADERLILVKLDLTCNQDVDSLIKRVTNYHETNRITRLVGLINNAGTLIYGEFDWLTWSQIQTQIDVNIVGTFRLTRAIIPFIIKSGGRIINVSSVNDATVFPGLSVYSATKSALSTFSRGLGYELRKFGVRVVTVRLGDFARLTNIMSSHGSNRDAMWSDMSLEKKTMYDTFFHQFNEHLLDNYGMTSPKKFQDSSLFQDFKIALLGKNPPSTITCAPLKFRLFYGLMELVPIWLQYHLLDTLIRIGFKWNPPKLVI